MYNNLKNSVVNNLIIIYIIMANETYLEMLVNNTCDKNQTEMHTRYCPILQNNESLDKWIVFSSLLFSAVSGFLMYNKKFSGMEPMSSIATINII